MKSLAIPRLLVLLTTIAIVVSTSPGAAMRHGSAQAAPTSVTLNPMADTYVYQGSPTTNYSSSIYLNVARDEFLQESFALLRFDLSSIPSNAVIGSAKLELHLKSAAGPASVSVDISRATSSWNASTVTWNTRPALVCCSGSAAVGTTSTYYPWDILALANGWLHGSFANYGLALRGPASISFERIFDGVGSNFPPRLSIVYELPTPTNTATPTRTSMPTNTPTPSATITPATSVTLSPVADTYVSQGAPSTNYGAVTPLLVGR